MIMVSGMVGSRNRKKRKERSEARGDLVPRDVTDVLEPLGCTFLFLQGKDDYLPSCIHLMPSSVLKF